MALNDFVRIRNDGSGISIELRNQPGAPEPVLTLRPGYVTLGGPPDDPGATEVGSFFRDPATGEIKHRGPLVEVP